MARSTHALLTKDHVWFELRYQPTNALSITVNPFVTILENKLEYVDTVSNFNGENVYLLGNLAQKTVGITFRFNLSVSPELTIQYYGQPFLSSGDYSEFKRVTAPRASDYADRYTQFSSAQISDHGSGTYSVDENGDGFIDYEFGDPDFNVRFFVSNLVLRWEFSPGSTFFLVWSQGRQGFDGSGDFSFRDDMKALYAVHPHNVLLVKISYWWDV